MKIPQYTLLVLVTAWTLAGCASANNQAATDPDDSPQSRPTHVVMVPHPGGNHIGGDDPYEMDPQ